jgi:hypothetical protein
MAETEQSHERISEQSPETNSKRKLEERWESFNEACDK